MTALGADRRVTVVGAGPAGLTAAYLLSQRGWPVTVLEADPRYVGGIARTIEHAGYRFDVGPHRFFSKAARVEALWDELLPDDMLTIDRRTRIQYRGRFFNYPLSAPEAFARLGAWESARAAVSYLGARCFPVREPRSFADWVSNQFGPRLFEIFFRTYTEKVWGMDCRDISADWAAQRIKGLSLGTALWNALRPRRANGSAAIRSLIETFRYPRLGAGMMWEAAARRTRAQGGVVRLGCRVVGLAYDDARREWTTTYVDGDGAPQALRSAHVVCSAALGDLALLLTPPLHARAHATALRYRDLVTVMLFATDRQRFADHWLYIHDPDVRVARIQNVRAWSPALIADPAMNAFGLEYFCFAADAIWQRRDADLIALATSELVRLSLAEAGDVTGGYVIRQPRAYPVYDGDYRRHVEVLRGEIATRYPNLHMVGRNGMHKYNNQDHAMMTAMLTVDALVGDGPRRDPWQVNEDAEYHEEDRGSGASGLRLVPHRLGA